MGKNIKIIAICLIKNEEFFIKHVLQNIIDFCDEIIVVDNFSTDSTYEIVRKLASTHQNINISRIKDRTKTQLLVQKYAGTPTWVFGVDGDELYDPEGLVIVKKNILAGMYSQYTKIYGNVLNCVDFDTENKVAKGYLSPPCRSMTKLYNYEIVEDCSDPGVERLHGIVKYKEGYSETDTLNVHEHYSWETSPFRCLHFCFMRRSHHDAKSQKSNVFARTSGVDLSQGGPRVRIKRLICRLFRVADQSSWKLDKYRQGELVEKDTSSFI